jgi:hypothetical protein
VLRSNLGSKLTGVIPRHQEFLELLVLNWAQLVSFAAVSKSEHPKTYYSPEAPSVPQEGPRQAPQLPVRVHPSVSRRETTRGTKVRELFHAKL